MIWKGGRRSVINHLGPLGKDGVLVTIRFFASRKEGTAGGGGEWGGSDPPLDHRVQYIKDLPG